VLQDKSSEDFVISDLRKGSKCKDCLCLGGQAFFRTPQSSRMKTVRSFETSGITNPIALCNACGRDNADETGYQKVLH
jgi:hypothetical protein